MKLSIAQIYQNLVFEITTMLTLEVTLRHAETQVAFKNCTPFTKCITKIYETTIYDAGELDLVMLMYNLLE